MATVAISKAQDKLYLRDGSVKQGSLASQTDDAVYFTSPPEERAVRYEKQEILIAEEAGGNRYLFAATRKKTPAGRNTSPGPRNFLSIEPLGVFVGRIQLVYERVNQQGTVGFAVPAGLTFDPYGTLYRSRRDSIQTNDFSFIVGADLNFYLLRVRKRNFYIGPRVRYGTDLLLRGITGFSLQSQIGWRWEIGQSAHHLAAGYGFVRIVDSPAGRLISPQQYYGWYSLTYRIGIGW
jgi:hypothetical protein